MADAVIATPWHASGSRSGRRNGRGVLGVDGPYDFPGNLLLCRLVRVNAVAAEREPEGSAASCRSRIREWCELVGHSRQRVERDIHAIGERPSTRRRLRLDDRVVSELQHREEPRLGGLHHRRWGWLPPRTSCPPPSSPPTPRAPASP